MKPTFKNTQNECTKTEDGRTVFLSRSVAVCVPVTLQVRSTGQIYDLLSQRGENTPDFQGCWNIVCGYLDHDERVYEAAIREVWEETGLYLPDHCDVLTQRYSDVPWGISDKPEPNSRQNVTIRYGYVLEVETEADIPVLTTANADSGEVAKSMWIPRAETVCILPWTNSFNPHETPMWAFNHYHVLREWIGISYA